MYGWAMLVLLWKKDRRHLDWNHFSLLYIYLSIFLLWNLYLLLYFIEYYIFILMTSQNHNIPFYLFFVDKYLVTNSSLLILIICIHYQIDIKTILLKNYNGQYIRLTSIYKIFATIISVAYLD